VAGKSEILVIRIVTLCSIGHCSEVRKLSIRMVAGFAELIERKENFGCGGQI
jgi:hypothetical protein